jgi:hypothetical protein
MTQRGRAIAAWAAWALVLPAAAGFLYFEDRLEPRPPVKGQEMKGFHPLVDMRFAEADREANLRKAGLPPDLFELAAGEARRLGARKGALAATLRDKVDPNNVAVTFCRQELPTLYRGAILLVSGAPGQTRLVDPTSAEFGTPWDAYPGGDMSRLFDRYEKPPDRQPEDTAMALAALLLGRVDRAVGSGVAAPWDRRAAEGGKFEYVHGAFPDVDGMLARYVAWTHVLAEIVEADPTTYGCGRDEAPAGNGKAGG